MVCLGNICRSPLAEGILRSKVDTQTIVVDSAGTGGWHVGELPDPRSIEVDRVFRMLDEACEVIAKQLGDGQ